MLRRAGEAAAPAENKPDRTETKPDPERTRRAENKPNRAKK
jgi:hypothetical protein